MIILETLIAGLSGLIVMKLWQKFIKRKEIWVIEDSESDIMLFKLNLRLDDYDVRYFQSVKGLQFKVIMSPPDAVICDYYLKDNIDGVQVRDFFRRNHIPVILTTCHDGDIKGVPEDAIIRKSPEPQYYHEIENWVHRVTA